jgi:murein L,D-transpeptidase YcbB/YkuD
MKKQWIAGLIGAIVLAMAIPAVSSASGTQSSTITKSSHMTLSATTSDVKIMNVGHRKQGHGFGKGHHKGHGKGGGLLGDHAHMEEYITLLSSKYAADLTDDWEKAFAARAPIVTELKALHDSGVKPDKSALKDNLTAAERKAKMEAKKALHDAFRAAVQKKDAVAIKASLTNMLKDYQDETKQLADMLAKLKAASTSTGSSS